MNQICIFVDGENLRHSIVDLFLGVFDKENFLPKNALWNDFFTSLTTRLTSPSLGLLRTYWYIVQHMDFWPWGLPVNRINYLQKQVSFPANKSRYQPELDQEQTKLLKILSKNKDIKRQIECVTDKNTKAFQIAEQLNQERRKMEERFKGWQNICDGIALKHKAIEFRRAGSIVYDLFERDFRTEKAVDVKLATDLITLKEIYGTAIIVSGDQDYVPAVQAIKDAGKRVINVCFLTRNKEMLPGGARRLNQITDDRIEVTYDEMKGFMNL